MKIINWIRHIKDNLIRRYRYWKLVYTLWLPRAILVDILLIGYIAFLLSAKGVIDNGLYNIIPNAEALDSLATTVENTPEMWQNILDTMKTRGEISEYQYKLQTQRLRHFASNAPELAEKIRDNRYNNILSESKWDALKQTVQFAGGKFFGYVGRIISSDVGEVGSELVEDNYATIGHLVKTTGEQLANTKVPVGENVFNLAWELEALALSENKLQPEIKIIVESEEYAEFLALIKTAMEKNPDMLMQAALYHQINLLIQKNDPNSYSDEEYRSIVVQYANNLVKLTQAGGSPDSIWKDVNDLANWLAARARRPLPETPEETTQPPEETNVSPVEPSPSPEEPFPTGLSPFAKYAIGSFLPPLPNELQGCQGNVIDFTFALTPYSEESYQVEEGLVGGTGRLILKKIGIEQMVDFRFEKTRYLPDTGTMEGEVVVTRTMKDASGEKKFAPGTIHWHGKKTGNPRFFEVGDIIEGVFDQAFDIFPKGFSFSLTIG